MLAAVRCGDGVAVCDDFGNTVLIVNDMQTMKGFQTRPFFKSAVKSRFFSSEAEKNTRILLYPRPASRKEKNKENERKNTCD